MRGVARPFSVVGAVVLAVALGACKPPAEGDWERLHRDLVRERGEAWQSIGWRLDVDAARAEATETGRPLFFWAMNGHPCGCT